MRILLAAVLLLPTAALADPAPPSPTAACAGDGRAPATAPPGRGGFHRLDRLPPAAEFLAVYRTIDHCPVPVIVRHDVAARPH